MMHVLTFSANVAAFQARLEAHYFNDIGLKKHIKTNEAETEFWIEPFKTLVLYQGGESLGLSKVKDHQALGIFDEDGNLVKPSIIGALNINPVNGKNEPVIIEWGIGEVRGPNCIFDNLSDEKKAHLRLFYPQFVTHINDEGDEIITERGLIWGELA